MGEENVGEGLRGLEIDPQTGWFLEVLDVAQKVAQKNYGTNIDGLRQRGEPTNDFSKISEVVHEAQGVVGPEDQFVADYQMWQETRKAGSHQMGFQEWRLARNEAYRIEYERLSKELEGNQS